MNNYSQASRIRRVVASYIDYLIVIGLSTLPLLVFLFIEDFVFEKVFSFFPVFMLVGSTLYLCKDCFKGVSPGRWLMCIAVRDRNDTDIIPNKKMLIIRNLTMLFWPIEFIVLLFSKNKQRLGDKISQTEVVLLEQHRNWIKMTIIAGFAVMISMSIFLLVIMQTLKNSEAYQTSLNYIQQNKEIQMATNGIEGYGFFTQGHINRTSSRSDAEFEIKVIGKTKNVTVWIELNKESPSEWQVKKMVYKAE